MEDIMITSGTSLKDMRSQNMVHIDLCRQF